MLLIIFGILGIVGFCGPFRGWRRRIGCLCFFRICSSSSWRLGILGFFLIIRSRRILALFMGRVFLFMAMFLGLVIFSFLCNFHLPSNCIRTILRERWCRCSRLGFSALCIGFYHCLELLWILGLLFERCLLLLEAWCRGLGLCKWVLLMLCLFRLIRWGLGWLKSTLFIWLLWGGCLRTFLWFLRLCRCLRVPLWWRGWVLWGFRWTTYLWR